MCNICCMQYKKIYKMFVLCPYALVAIIRSQIKNWLVNCGICICGLSDTFSLIALRQSIFLAKRCLPVSCQRSIPRKCARGLRKAFILLDEPCVTLQNNKVNKSARIKR